MAKSAARSIEELVRSDGEHQFPVFSSGFLEAMGSLGLTRVGVAMAILNADGEVLIEAHKGNRKILPGTQCLPTETSDVSATGIVEPVARTIARGIFEELDYFADSRDFTTRAERPFTSTEWPIGNHSIKGSLLGINCAMLVRQDLANSLVGEKRNDEIDAAYFMPIETLLRSSALRPGTEACITSLRDVGLLDPNVLAEVPVVLPDISEPRLLGPLT